MTEDRAQELREWTDEELDRWWDNRSRIEQERAIAAIEAHVGCLEVSDEMVEAEGEQ